MTGQHARRYSRIREWRTGGMKPRHRKTRDETFGEIFRVEFAKRWPPRDAA